MNPSRAWHHVHEHGFHLGACLHHCSRCLAEILLIDSKANVSRIQTEWTSTNSNRGTYVPSALEMYRLMYRLRSCEIHRKWISALKPATRNRWRWSLSGFALLRRYDWLTQVTPHVKVACRPIYIRRRHESQVSLNWSMWLVKSVHLYAYCLWLTFSSKSIGNIKVYANEKQASRTSCFVSNRTELVLTFRTNKSMSGVDKTTTQ